MNDLIACCGLDCSTCEAYIATINNDDNLRRQTAEKWTTLYNAPNITAEMINCTGCRMEGVKIGHCSECDIRNCVHAKGFATCGDCSELDACEIVAKVHQFAPAAKLNLKSA